MHRYIAALGLVLLTAVRPAAAADYAGAGEPPAADANAASAMPLAPLGLELNRDLAGSARPPRGPALPALYLGLAGLNAFDAYITTVGLANGATEANPLVRPVAGHPAVLWAVKGGVTAGSILLAERLWRQKRRGAAITMMVLSNGVMAAVAARNVGVLGRAR